MRMANGKTEGDRRLARLEGYLLEDPANPALLADVCEAAISAGQHERALALVDRAERLDLNPAEWTFRRARLNIARRDLPEAERLLLALQTREGGHPVIAHDLAHIAFLQGRWASARSVVAPWLERPTIEPEALQALQVLWLRATHRMKAVQEGWAWVLRQLAANRLQPRAQGIASLLAIDAEHFAQARDLADRALACDPDLPEALVARASVALADDQTELAFRLLRRALQLQPDDGRAWSAMAFASLQARDFVSAEAQFRRALASTMSEHIGSWHGLGWTCLLRGDRAGARIAFERALALDRNFSETHGAIGLLLVLEGRREQAQHHLRVADRLDPCNVTGRFAQALASGELRDPGQIGELAKRLLSRPGLFGGTLADAVLSRLQNRDHQARACTRP